MLYYFAGKEKIAGNQQDSVKPLPHEFARFRLKGTLNRRSLANNLNSFANLCEINGWNDDHGVGWMRMVCVTGTIAAAMAAARGARSASLLATTLAMSALASGLWKICLICLVS